MIFTYIHSLNSKKVAQSILLGIDPCFKNIDVAYYGQILKDKMICAWIIPRLIKKKNLEKSQRVYCVIQWNRKTDALNAEAFTNIAHFVLKTYAAFISSRLEKLILDKLIYQYENRAINALKSFQDITQQRNIASIYKVVTESLPKVFSAKWCELLINNIKDEEFMYTITGIGTDKNGVLYIKTSVSYPK